MNGNATSDSDDFWDGYDWSLVEDWTGEELSEEDKDNLSDIASEIQGFLTEKLARQLAIGAVVFGSALFLAQWL